MMPMIISFCPVLYSFNFSSILIFIHFYQTQSLIFRQVQFFQYIHKLPILSQSICYRTGGSYYSATNLIQHSESLFSYILCVSQIPINKSFRNIFLLHFQFPEFCSLTFKQTFATIKILLQAFFSIFLLYEVISCFISFLNVNRFILQCLIRQ